MKDFSDFSSEAHSELFENYGDNTNDPKKLEKELPKGYKYGTPRQGKGDHKTSALHTPDGTETDITIGGASKGKSGSYSPSWKAEHNKAKKTLRGIDAAVKEIKGSKSSSSDTAKRMNKAGARLAKTAASKAISDMTGVGRKTNVQGKGNKAGRRASSLREFAEALQDDMHPIAANKKGIDSAASNGFDSVDSHESMHGETELNNPESLGKLAASMGRLQKSGATSNIYPDKTGPKSLFAQEQELDQPTEVDGDTQE